MCRPYRALAALILASLACTPEGTEPSGGPAPHLRQATTEELVGTWGVGFRLSPDSPADTLGGTSIVGTLVISADTVDLGGILWLEAEFRADFTALLGRQASCLTAPQASLVQIRAAEHEVGSRSFRLWFTPGAADCGVFALGGFDGSGVEGFWEEGHFVASTVFGDFTMTRSP